MDDPTKIFAPRDVQKNAGLTYRQLNSWDARGLLPPTREDSGWRRFSPNDLFVLMVLAEMREKLGIPLERLKYVSDLMHRPGANHLVAAGDLMDLLGVGVFILTDLEKTFVMDSELEMKALWGERFFGGDEEAAYVLLKVNPLVNRMVEALTDGGHITAHGRGYKIAEDLRRLHGAASAEERRVLDLIRSGEFRSVEVTLRDGEIRTIRTTGSRKNDVGIIELLAEHDFQKIIVTKSDGKIVVVEQQVTERHVPATNAVRSGEEEPPGEN